jgi:hypothetical protein
LVVLGGDPAIRSRRVEQFIACEACIALGASDGLIHSRISLEVICLKAIINDQNIYGDRLLQCSSKTALSRARREGMFPCRVY